MADDDDTEDQEELQPPPQQVAVAERPDEHDYDTTQVEPSKKDEWADFRVQQPEQQAPQPQAAKDEWAEFRTQPEQKPEAESPLRSFLRNVAHQALPALASVPGAEAGAAAGGALGTAIAPGVGTVVGGLAGGLLGAGLAGGVTSYAQESAAKAIGMDDSQQRAINAAVNPTTELISNVAPMALIGGPGRVATTLGGEALRRAAMGGLGAATEVGQEVIGGEKVDPYKAGAQFVGGALFAKPYGWTERLGQRIGATLPLGERPPSRIPGAPPADIGPPQQPYRPPEGELPLGPGRVAPEQQELPLQMPVRYPAEWQGDLGIGLRGEQTDLPFRQGEAFRPSPEQAQQLADQARAQGNTAAADLFDRMSKAGEGGRGRYAGAPAVYTMPEQHGAPGAMAAKGVAEQQPPPNEQGARPDIGNVASRPVRSPGAGPEDYGKKPSPQPVAGMEQASPEVDAAVKAALQPEPGAAPPEIKPAGEGVWQSGQHSIARATDAQGRPTYQVRAGDQVLSEHPYLGQAQLALRKAQREAAAPTPAQKLPPAPAQAAVQRLPQDPGTLRTLAASVRRGGNEAQARSYEDMANNIEAAQRRQAAIPAAPPQGPAPKVRQQAQQIQPEGEPELRPPNRQQAQQAQQEPPVPEWVQRAQAAREAAARAPPTRAAPPAAERPPPAVPPPQRPQGTIGQLTAKPRSIWEQLQNVFAPHMRGGGQGPARQVADWIRGAYGSSNQLHEQANDILNQHRDTVRAMNQDDLRALVNRAQGGNAFPNWKPNKPQQALLGDIKRVTGMWADKLGTLDRAKQMEWIENYLPGMYKNGADRQEYFNNITRGAGGAGSLKQKAFPDYEAARAAGLEPYTNDPIRMLQLYGEKMRNFVGRQEAMEKGLRTGMFIKPDKAPQVVGAAGSPEPYVRSNLPPNYVESKTSPGVYMPEEVVNTWDNFHAAGLRGGRQRDLYEAMRNANSAWTNLELSFNGYHAFTMANEAVISDVAQALEKFAGGKLGAGVSTLAKAPAAFITRARLGSKVQRGYLDPRSSDPITQALVKGGFRPIGRSHAQDARIAQQTFLDSFKDIPQQLQRAVQDTRQDWLDAKGNVLDQIKIPFQLAGRAVATVSHPLFNVYIPKLKAGAAYAQMQHWREFNPDKIGTPEETAAARKIIDSIDNRFGEMATDHLFMNKVVQDMGVAGLRSFSWLMGSAKEIGGGTFSGARALALRRNVLNPASPHYDPRVAYAIAMPMVIAGTSAAYQYLLGSGDAPASWRDLYAPRTGGMVKGPGKGGAPAQEHLLMPGYHKDVHGWLADPLTEAYNKLGGFWSTAIEEARGRGSPAIGSPPIIRPGASFTENVTDRMAYLMSKLGPIGARAYIQGQKQGSKIPDWMAAAGFHAPGMDIQAPEQLEKLKTAQQKREWKAMTNAANRAAKSRGQPLPYPVQSYQQGGYVASSPHYDAAVNDLDMNDQEKALYQRHLQNLWGTGGVDHPDGSRSSLYQAVEPHDGKFYNVPTVWNGKVETERYTRPSDGQVFDVPNATAKQNIAKEGWDKFPSYPTPEQADSRYEDMHKYMERDTADYMAGQQEQPSVGDASASNQ